MRQKINIGGSENYTETVSVFNLPEQTYDATLNDSDKSFAVPGNEVWKLCNAHITLVSDATVGNRQMVLEVANSASAVVFSSAAGAVQAASVTRVYDFMQGITKETAFVGAVIQVPIPTEQYILPGYSIRIYDSAAISAAGDDMTVAFQVEKFVI
ncbi:MAG: hypothetical protein ABUJ92_00515 [Desulfobacterales bacterium]